MSSEWAPDPSGTPPTARWKATLPVRLDVGQLATLDAFQRVEGLASREAALGVLVGIALETFASPGPRLQQPVWSARDVYRSSNGDVWSLLHEAGSGRLRVRHRANAASGGHCREMDVDAFLLTGNGPEHAALRALVSGLGKPASADGGPARTGRSAG